MNKKREPSPLVGEGGGDSRRKGQVWADMWNDSDLCTQACPFRLAGSALPGQRRSVSLRFRVAMLLKTQFACHRVRGKQRLRKKKIIFFIIFIYAFMYIPCRILTAPVGRVWRLIAFSRRSAPKNTIRLPSLLITAAQEWRQGWNAFLRSSKWLFA